MRAGEKVKWRNKSLMVLISRTITKDEYPNIAKQMADDGLIAILTSKGIQWYAGRYLVPKTSVREIWSLSRSQLDSFERWVYMNDPFMDLLAEEE